MKKALKYIIIYGIFLAQSIIFEDMKIFSCTPDFLTAALVLAVFYTGHKEAACLGAFAGLVKDAVCGSLFGVNLILYMYFALAVSLIFKKNSINSPVIMAFNSFVSVFAFKSLIFVLAKLAGSVIPFKTAILKVFVNSVFASLIAFLFVFLVQAAKKRRTTVDKEAAA